MRNIMLYDMLGKTPPQDCGLDEFDLVGMNVIIR